MKISIIVAITENNIIGKDNGMPWHLPADLKYFRERTTGHHIVMGRKTFESIGGGRPLPNRTSIIITTQKDYKAEGCLVAHSLEEALTLAKNESELFIIGGRQIYELSLAIADKLYITRIHETIEGDTTFPEFNSNDWILNESIKREADEKNAYNVSFQVFDKKK